MVKIKEDDEYIYIRPRNKTDEKILRNAGGEYNGDGVYRLNKKNEFISLFV